jgi:hypothetical protein
MTRTHAARQLLALGPLSLPEFMEITGWKYRCCVQTLARLRGMRQVRYVRRGNNHATSVYEVAR